MNALERLGLRSGAYHWHHFIARSGGAGQRWVRDFTEHHGDDLTALVDRGLGLLRRRRVGEGRVHLRQAAERLEVLRCSAPAPVMCVLERWYYSALAYEHYLDEDYDRAENDFELAQEAIRAAIEELPCLVMTANHCYDFCLQRARIARSRSRWRAMKDYIEAGRAMLENRRPLCILDNGGEIFVETIDAFHRAIEPRDPEEHAALEEIFDSERRRRIFEKFVKDNYALPGIVIPYQPSAPAVSGDTASK